jgi:hypothetical protein
MSYEQKYLKYKQKYLLLKSQLEGGLNINPFRYSKVVAKPTDSEELKQFINNKNGLIDQINNKKNEIKSLQTEISNMIYADRQEFKKQAADAKLDALKVQTGGGFNIYNRVNVPESEALKAKKAELVTKQTELSELEKQLDKTSELVKAQTKSDHYKNKLAKSVRQPVDQSVGQSTVEPVAQSVAQSVDQSVAQPVGQSVAQPVAQPVAVPASPSGFYLF